ncbi:inosine triphosphate pyrophosphatase-like protein [Chytriomyces sp. MP71]|nr:inosine triphosphate pyrophosphatase-like protein [Chytriomyces sp. MP71]
MSAGRVITFVTGNANKLKEVQAILASSPQLSLTNRKLDLPELQAASTAEVSIDKCKRAAEIVNGPVLVEDTSLCFNAINSLPGPYIKWFLEGVGHEGLNKMLDGFSDRSAYALCTFAYMEGPGKEVHLFEGKTDGTIVRPRGPLDFGWDPIFEPKGYNVTYAEMEKSTKNAISHRGRALEKVKEFFADSSN